MLEHIGENIANRISSGFRDVSSQMGAFLANLEAKPMLVVSTSTPSSLSVDPAGPPQKLIFTNQPLPQLDRADYPKVRQWFMDGYNGCRKAGMAAEEGDGQVDGPKSSVLLSFMEDKEGHLILPQIKKDVREVARFVFWKFLRNGHAPAKWGDACLDVSNKLIYELETKFKWLWYCEGHWKAKKIAINSYP